MSLTKDCADPTLPYCDDATGNCIFTTAAPFIFDRDMDEDDEEFLEF